MSDSASTVLAAHSLPTVSREAGRPKGQKRKRDDGGETTREGDDEASEKPKPAKRKKKSKKSKAPPDIRDEDLNAELSVNEAFGRMNASLVADLLAQRTQRWNQDASAVELDDMRIPQSAILDTSGFSHARTIDNMPKYLEKFCAENPRDAPKPSGTPHTLVVCGAGLLCADVVRSLRVFSTEGKITIGKLFAQHQKMKDTAAKLVKTRMNIGVGTPQRLFDLLEDGALHAERLRRIVVFASHIDVKKRGLLDMRDTHVALVRLLTRSDLKKRYDGKGKEKLELWFY